MNQSCAKRSFVASTSRCRKYLPDFLEWGVYILLVAWMIARTWLTWTDTYIDFGAEIYTAWQIAEGKHLYTDIARYFGPLSSYFNGAWLALVGVSLHKLYFLNFLVYCGIFASLYVILRQITTRLARFAGLSLFILLFSFSTYSEVANDNYLSPYVHEITHGFLLALLALLAAGRALCAETLQLRRFIWPGIFCGLLLLSKQEVALAGLGAVACGGCLTWWTRKESRMVLLKGAGVFLMGMLLALGFVFGLLCFAMSPAVAWKGMIFPWQCLFNPVVNQMPYFQQVMGTDHLAANLRRMVWPVIPSFLGFGAAFGVVSRMRLSKWTKYAGIGLLVCAAVWLMLQKVDYLLFPRTLPIFLTFYFILVAWRAWKGLENGDFIIRAGMWGVFAGLMLLKILFYTRVWHYGFVLAVPASLIFVSLLLDWGPKTFLRTGSVRVTACVLGLIFVGLWSFVLVRGGGQILRQGPYPSIGQGGDLYRGTDRSADWVRMAGWIQSNTPEDATLACVPSAAMMNYLTRRPSSIPHIALAPPEYFSFGEETVFAAFRENPPDYLLYVNHAVDYFGFPFFGVGYASEIFQWMLQNYYPVHTVGPPVLRNAKYGLTLFVHQ